MITKRIKIHIFHISKGTHMQPSGLLTQGGSTAGRMGTGK